MKRCIVGTHVVCKMSWSHHAVFLILAFLSASSSLSSLLAVHHLDQWSVGYALATPQTVSAVMEAKITAVHAARFDVLFGFELSCSLRAMTGLLQLPSHGSRVRWCPGLLASPHQHSAGSLVHQVFTEIISKSHIWPTGFRRCSHGMVNASTSIQRCRSNWRFMPPLPLSED